jgi:hypothetical protein
MNVTNKNEIYNSLFKQVQLEFAGENADNNKLLKLFKSLLLEEMCGSTDICVKCTDSCTTVTLVGCTRVTQGTNTVGLTLTGNAPFTYNITTTSNCVTLTNGSGSTSSAINLILTGSTANCISNAVFRIDITDNIGCTTTAYFTINQCHAFAAYEQGQFTIEDLYNGFFTGYTIEYTPTTSTTLSYLWTCEDSEISIPTNNTSTIILYNTNINVPICQKQVTLNLTITDINNCQTVKTLNISPTC